MGILVNGDRLPILSALTCVMARSDIPNIESLGEALVIDADGGAMAVFAPTGLSLSGSTHQLNMIFAKTLERAAEDTPLGALVLDTLTAFGAAGGGEEMLNAYTITGDPAVVLP